MKVFLQNTKTEKFLMSDGGWATGGPEVRVFKSSADAVVFSVENHLDDMQVILRFDDSRYDEKLPLLPLYAQQHKPLHAERLVCTPRDVL